MKILHFTIIVMYIRFLKSIVGIIVCFILLLNIAQAKVYSSCPYPQHEIGVSYGYMSIDQLAVRLGSEFAGHLILPIFSGNEFQNEKYRSIGPVSVNYKYFFKERLSVGGSLVYSKTHLTYDDLIGNHYSDTYHAVTLLPKFDFYYVRNPKFALYGNVGLGVTIFKATDDQDYNDRAASFAFQVTPIAMRVGRDFGFVLEFGFGSQGFVNGGVSYRHYDRPWSFN